MADEATAENQPDYDGYPNLDELKKAKRASGDEAKRLKNERDVFAQEVQRLQAEGQRQAVPQRGRPEDRLNDLGIPVDAIDEIVNARIQKAFEPISQAYQGRNQMLSQYGNDYSKYEADVAAFVGADPNLNQTYQRIFQADPAGAMEYAFLKFGDSERKKHGQAVKDGKAAASERDKDRAEAGIPTSRSGDTRVNDVNGSQAELREAWENGDRARYIKLRLGQAIPDSFLNR